MQLVYDRVGRPGAWIQNEVENVIKADSHWHSFNAAGGTIDFVPASWEKWLPDVGIDARRYPKSWIVCRFQIDGHRLVFYIEVRRVQDTSLRTKVVTALLSKSDSFEFKKPQNRSTIGDQYTRVTGKDELMEWNEVSEPTADAIVAAVKKKLTEIQPKLVLMGDTLRNVVGVERNTETQSVDREVVG